MKHPGNGRGTLERERPRNAENVRGPANERKAQLTDQILKTCTKCGEAKPLEGFYSGRANCKECQKAEVRARRAANPESHQARDRQRHHADRERRNAQRSEHWHTHKEEKNAERRAEWAADPEGHRAASRAYLAANSERINELRRASYALNRETVLERNRQWRRDNPEWVAQYEALRRVAHNEYKRQYNKTYYRENTELYELHRRRRAMRLAGVESEDYSRYEIYDRDGGHCRDCEKALPREPGGFQIDHIVPISLGGPDTRANVQLMCPPCNREKWATLEGQIALPM